MMKKTINIILVILMLASIALLSADYNHAAPFLKMGTDAKAMGMGGAVTASHDNINSAYWNPANLNFLKTFEFATTFNDLEMDRKLSYFSLGQKFDFGVLAFSWMSAGVSDLLGYDDNDVFTGKFDSGENNLALSYANCYKGVNAGITLKYYLNTIDEDTESGTAIDLGLNYPIKKYNLNIALMLRDLYSSEIAGEAVPMQYNFGAAWKPYEYLTLATDLRGEKGYDKTVFALGAEYWNWIMPYYEEDSFLNDTKGGLRLGLRNGKISAGFGLKIRWVEFNYAYFREFDGIFDDTHQFSFVFRPWDDDQRPAPEPVIIYETIIDTTYLEPEIEEVSIVQITGNLMDEFAQPVSARLDWKRIEDEDYTMSVITDADGFYEVYLDKNATYEYLVNADDYFVEIGYLEVASQDIADFNIMLTKLDFSRFGINFDYDSAVIRKESYAVLDNVVSVLREYEDTKIEIAGHTDDAGGEQYNMQLALRRAQAVKEYFVSKGISAANVHAVGYGYKYPIATNKSDEGRAKNRRIELRILESGAIKEGVLGCVSFESGQANVNAYSQACLDMLAGLLIKNPTVKIEIAAFTDNVGDDAQNLTLSQKRAQAVVEYLIKKGVSPANLSPKGYGKAKPVAPNSTPEGREKNRRIEIKILAVDTMETGILENIFFESGKAVLSRESYPSLNKLAAQMIANPKMKLEICGYTDNIGNETNNLDLSQRRAEAVVTYLVSAGISDDRLIATGFGSQNPIASNDTLEGRAKNRRIEVKILE
jgi:outer membrane protein OmpA-like peptidoglycan-associated protein